MTILNSRKNSRIGNKGFSEKNPVFTDSEFIITKELSSKTIWNKEAINERQNQFALDSIKCWKIK